MKHSILFMTAFALFAAGTVEAKKTAMVAAPGLYPMMIANPGQFNIRQENISQLLAGLLKAANVTQKVDRDYLQSSVAAIQAEYTGLVTLVRSGNLMKLSQRSINGESIPAKEFFEVINEVNTQFDVVESQLTALTAINPQTLPSSVGINDGKNVQAVAQYGRIDFSSIIKEYSSRIALLKAGASNYYVKVQFEKTKIVEIIKKDSGTTLNPQFSQPAFSADEIAQLRKEISELRSNMDVREIGSVHADKLRQLIQSFVTNYGTDERYRFRDDASLMKTQGRGDKTVLAGLSNDDYFTARNQQFQKIVEMFWQRSYLRTKYGVQIGAIQTSKYQKRWLNVDKFLVMTEALRQFRSEVAITEVELMEATENVRMTLKVLDERSTNILGDQSSPNLLVKASSLVTFVGGRRPSAEALFMIMQLVAGDIKEENMLNSGGGLQSMEDFYRQRYQSTEENKKFYTRVKCATDDDYTGDKSCLDSNAQTANAFSEDVKNNVAGGIRKDFNDLNGHMQTLSMQIEQANKIAETLRVAVASQAGFVKIKSRADSL